MSSLDKVSRILESTSKYTGEVAGALSGKPQVNNEESHHKHHTENSPDEKPKKLHKKHNDESETKFRQKGHATSTKGKMLDKVGAHFC